MKHNERDDKWFFKFPSGMIECGGVVMVNTVCVKSEKCANIRTLVYKMQVRLRESLWSILGQTL